MKTSKKHLTSETKTEKKKYQTNTENLSQVFTNEKNLVANKSFARHASILNAFKLMCYFSS